MNSTIKFPNITLENSFVPFNEKQGPLEQNSIKNSSSYIVSSQDVINSIHIPNSSHFQNNFFDEKEEEFNYQTNNIEIPKNKKSLLFKKLNISPIKKNQTFAKTVKYENNLPSLKVETKKKSFYDVITNLYLIKKFNSNLMGVSFIKKPKFLNKIHFELINDKSFFLNVYNKNRKNSINIFNNLFNSSNLQNFFKRIFKKSLCCFKKIKVFTPFDLILIFLNGINILIYVFYLFFVPTSLCFNLNYLNEEATILDLSFRKILIFTLFFTILDILINFNKAFYSKGELIFDRKSIALFYINNYFIFDLLSFVCILPSFFNYSTFDSKYSDNIFLGIFLLLKIKKNMHLIKQMEELFIIDQTYFNLYEIIKLLTRIIIISHFAACIWYVITIETSNNINWIESMNLLDSDWKLKYLYSFYFIIITMNTVGYGDITPQNPKEIIFCICFVFLACSLFAYCINCIGNIFKEIYQRESGFRADLFSINEFMRNKNVNKTLQIRIRKYLEYIWKEEKIQNIELSKNVINKLSSSLKSDLMLEANGPLIADIDLFTKNFSEKTLRSLIDIMTEERFTPGEIIFEKGAIDNHDLFIIKRGNVEVFVENNFNDTKKKLIKLSEGKTFGEISFFSEMERTASVQSSDFTTLLRVNQEKFKKIIKENPEDYEKFNFMKDSINLYRKFDSLFIKCYSCNQSNHIITNCKIIHRNFLKDIVISKFNYSIFQERSNNKRKMPKKFNALKLIKRNKEKDLKNISVDISSQYQYEELNDEDQKNSLEIKDDDTFNKKKIQHSNSLKIDSLNNLTQIEEITSNERNDDNQIKDPEYISNKITDFNSPTLKIPRLSTSIIKGINILSANNKESEKLIDYSAKFDEENNKTNYINDCYTESALPLNERIHFKTKKLEIKNNKDEKDLKKEILIDSLKIYLKYFPHNNFDKVIQEINVKTLKLLKKLKKCHLFSKNNFNEKTNNTPELKSIVIISPGKKNVLRKKSEVLQNWKEDLQKLKSGKKNSKTRKNTLHGFLDNLKKKIF